jgi:hypothetical protein
VSTCDNEIIKIEENIIRNTFLNSKIEAEANLAKKKTAKGKKKNNKTSTSTKKQPQRKKIQWVDQQTRGRQYLET